MISKVLIGLQNGLNVIKSNSRMAMVAVLVFVFPILFLWITQSFFITAYENINSSEKKRISLLHDSIASAIESTDSDPAVLNNLINKVKVGNSDITKIRVVERDAGEYKIILSSDQSQVGQVEKTGQLYDILPSSAEVSSFIFETSINGSRSWQTFRKVTLEDKELVIFSEHSFAVIDSTMFSRKQQSYFGFTAIFLFLMALAYWLNRQDHWEKKHGDLKTMLEERDMFSNMIAHEFRTPLTAIKGYSSFLEESKSIPDAEKRYATNIHVSAERLVVLVNDFLEVARLQSGKLKLKIETIKIYNLLQRVTEDLQSLATEKGLELELIQPKDVIILDTDKDRMVQVLTNMITNSIKYTKSGKVTIECSEERGKVIVTIKDTGMGISADDQQKLFTPFTRVGGVDETTTTGSGLGMWITKQIVAHLNGTIGIESIKGVGTHVIMTFKVDTLH